jgi:hypothetical protein
MAVHAKVLFLGESFFLNQEDFIQLIIVKNYRILYRIRNTDSELSFILLNSGSCGIHLNFRTKEEAFRF